MRYNIIIRNKRLLYITITAITIGMGLFIRIKKDRFPEIFNQYAGDALYAVMMYFLISIIANKRPVFKAVIALTVCYAIELSQLYKAVWIEAIRQTMPGRLVLGSGFLYSDLLAYAIGTAFAFFIDCLLIDKGQGAR
ncbi:DUF2809 domain-containing protein [Flavobacterium sp.]|uniref:ribosomal maturation YjgA family protein n=1 Tax=Flavobacterium sp. TaxID=239 RepID=UPI002611A02A|nr:DUF2809 domain-containing protein [Flavobacterium sp.]